MPERIRFPELPSLSLRLMPELMPASKARPTRSASRRSSVVVSVDQHSLVVAVPEPLLQRPQGDAGGGAAGGERVPERVEGDPVLPAIAVAHPRRLHRGFEPLPHLRGVVRVAGLGVGQHELVVCLVGGYDAARQRPRVQPERLPRVPQSHARARALGRRCRFAQWPVNARGALTRVPFSASSRVRRRGSRPRGRCRRRRS